MACTLHNMTVIKRQNPSKGEFVELLLSTIGGTVYMYIQVYCVLFLCYLGFGSNIDFFSSIALSQTPSNLVIHCTCSLGIINPLRCPI